MLRKLLVAPLVFTTVLSSNAFAQQRHVIDPATLADTVSQRAAEQEAQRSEVREALARPEVRDLAARTGVSMDQLTASVATLAGGASVIVISTTTIIIVLLLILLLVAIAD